MIALQYALALGVKTVLIPWEGQNPRDLTKIRMRLSSQQERRGHAVDPEQYDFFVARERVVNEEQGVCFAGAPLLFPFK